MAARKEKNEAFYVILFDDVFVVLGLKPSSRKVHSTEQMAFHACVFAHACDLAKQFALFCLVYIQYNWFSCHPIHMGLSRPFVSVHSVQQWMVVACCRRIGGAHVRKSSRHNARQHGIMQFYQKSFNANDIWFVTRRWDRRDRQPNHLRSVIFNWESRQFGVDTSLCYCFANTQIILSSV